MLVVLSLRWRLQTRPAKSARCMLTRWGCWYCWQYRLVEREEVEYNSPGPAVRPQSLQNTALSWSYKDHWLRSVGPPPLGTSSWCLMWTTVEGCTCWGNSQDRTLWSLGPERRDSGQQGNSRQGRWGAGRIQQHQLVEIHISTNTPRDPRLQFRSWNHSQVSLVLQCLSCSARLALKYDYVNVGIKYFGNIREKHCSLTEWNV